jgi:hypothetical protein
MDVLPLNKRAYVSYNCYKPQTSELEGRIDNNNIINDWLMTWHDMVCYGMVWYHMGGMGTNSMRK